MAQFGIGVIVLFLLFYFLPTIIAMLSGKLNILAILALNLFLGWTFVGWIIALVWALTNDTRTQTIVVNNLVSEERTVNPIIVQPFQENSQNLPNTESLLKQQPELEISKLQSHQDKITQLLQLKLLLDAEILTKEEFDEQKTKILSS